MGYLINSIFTLSFDPLSVFFLAVIAVVSLPSAVYSIGYLKNQYTRRRIVLGWAILALFVLSMSLVVTVKNAFSFIIVWELMSLASYFLVIFDSEHDRSIQAGTIYIVMTHIGTAFIIAAILIIFGYSHSFDFAAMKAACPAMSPGAKNLAFLLFLGGFGTKAGIVPLHVWLPYAHPQAPSHISSIMSGVMIKTAIYAFIRFTVMIIGVQAAWWGGTVLVIAAISCLVGVIYALMEHDIKKLLAYHSVENIGIILLGVGASVLFLKLQMPAAAVLAMAAGLYHLINHSIFKGLLFLSAGSVYKATGRRNMERMGGLIKTMPVTAVSFLIGAMAISALPPLNGFVSEWLTFQAFFTGVISGAAGIKIFMGLLAGVLALTSGLAAACFVKAFGITFLAMPRSQSAHEAKESPFSMKLAMIFLAILAVVFGLAAPFILKVLVCVSGSILAIDTSQIAFTFNGFIIMPPVSSGAYLSPSLIALALLAIAGITVLTVYLLAGAPRRAVNRTWDCGYYKLDSRTEYTATAFSKPFRIAFNFFLKPYRKTEKIRESFYHVKSFKYEVYTTLLFKEYIYEPILRAVFKISDTLKRMQSGSIHLYIAYIFITMIALIIFMSRF
ncbi:MAG: proton-conducting transporter membrane subunit [Candidatus Omnitrophota bacterium]